MIAPGVFIRQTKPFRVTVKTLAARGQQSSRLPPPDPYELAQTWHIALKALITHAKSFRVMFETLADRSQNTSHIRIRIRIRPDHYGLTELGAQVDPYVLITHAKPHPNENFGR